MHRFWRKTLVRINIARAPRQRNREAEQDPEHSREVECPAIFMLNQTRPIPTTQVIRTSGRAVPDLQGRDCRQCPS